MFDPCNFYKGFFLKEALGNNQFSFEKRKQKQIYVAPLKKGKLSDLSVGKNIAFSEYSDGKEYNYPGLENFIHFELNGKEIFIFDNHNHAFFFWIYAYHAGIINFGENLVHIDQHTDMRKPEKWLAISEMHDALKIFEYTNFSLNVGNFIQPALQLNLFKKIDIIDSSISIEKRFYDKYVLDLDMDFFSPEMNYIPEDLKIKKISELMEKASFITIATSPFFIDQQNAIEKINRIFKY